MKVAKELTPKFDFPKQKLKRYVCTSCGTDVYSPEPAPNECPLVGCEGKMKYKTGYDSAYKKFINNALSGPHRKSWTDILDEEVSDRWTNVLLEIGKDVTPLSFEQMKTIFYSEWITIDAKYDGAEVVFLVNAGMRNQRLYSYIGKQALYLYNLVAEQSVV